MSVSGLPFDDFRALLRDLPGPDARALVAARERDAQLTKPPGGLGGLRKSPSGWLPGRAGHRPSTGRWWRSLPETMVSSNRTSRRFRHL
jgi:nicotinate-nucleotide--dimethylbenzimidazole phosphoribosyltransferase